MGRWFDADRDCSEPAFRIFLTSHWSERYMTCAPIRRLLLRSHNEQPTTLSVERSTK